MLEKALEQNSWCCNMWIERVLCFKYCWVQQETAQSQRGYPYIYE